MAPADPDALKREYERVSHEVSKRETTVVLGWVMLAATGFAAALSGNPHWPAVLLMVVGLCALIGWVVYSVSLVREMRALRKQQYRLQNQVLDMRNRREGNR